MKIERIYHPYWLWEDYQFGMYGSPKTKRSDLTEKIAECLGDPQTCEKFMHRIITEWKYTCEYHLTNTSNNRVAWLGQAAMCLYAGLKESETRSAWWTLSDEQRERANTIAKQMIEEWEKQYDR